MADKSVGELIAATSVTPTDLFVLEQNGTAKKLTGQTLENWLVSFADGHGGIQNIEKVKTSGLVDTYRITLADTTTFDFMVTNGKGIYSVSKVSTSGLVDTYRITFNDGTSSTFTVTNGEKGDKGDNTYLWVKYASQQPTSSSHSFGDLPDAWIGVYFGGSSAAPTDWTQYAWYQWKGAKGDTGAPATLVSAQVSYQVGDSGTIIPSGSWQTSVPTVPSGKYLWTRQVIRFNTGSPITSYSVSRYGIDGSGSVSTVAGVAPDLNGNVPLDASSVNALPIGGGTMGGSINMNGQKMSGLNEPAASDEVANKSYADKKLSLELLWTNGSPSSAFDAHSEPIDTTGMPMVAIEFRATKTGSARTLVIGMSGTTIPLNQIMNVTSSTAVIVASRTATIGDKIIDFSDCSTKGISSTNATVNNDRIIPTRVFGIKGAL